MNTFQCLAAFLLLSIAFPLQGSDSAMPGAHIRIRIPLASSSAEILKEFYYEDGAKKKYSISQTSEPDEVCKWLGYGEALYFEAADDAGKGNVLIKNGKLFAENEPTEPLTELVCTVTAPKERLRPLVESKARVSDQTIELRNLEVISEKHWSTVYFFSFESDLTSICRLFGYTRGISATTRPEIRLALSNTEKAVKVKLDSKDQIVSYEVKQLKKNQFPDFKIIPSGEYIRNVTCQK